MASEDLPKAVREPQQPRFWVREERDPRNRGYMVEAIAALALPGEPVRFPAELEWLMEPDRDNRDMVLKGQILAGLGRLLHTNGHEAMRDVALQIAEVRPSVKEALAMIKRASPADAAAPSTNDEDVLPMRFACLDAAMNDVRERNPDASDADVMLIFARTWDIVKSFEDG